MHIEYKDSFKKDIEKIQNTLLLNRINNIIKLFKESISLFQIPYVKKLKGYKNYYRIKIGNFRLGFKSEENTIILLRFLHRKDIYKFFP